VVAIREGGGGGKYPKVTARVGASPPQYPGLDEEDNDERPRSARQRAAPPFPGAGSSPGTAAAIPGKERVHFASVAAVIATRAGVPYWLPCGP